MKQIAIKVENKRQFDALMKHYEEKGWRSFLMKLPEEWEYEHRADGNNSILYCNGYKWVGYDAPIKYIDFDLFSQLTGVKEEKEMKLEICIGMIEVTVNEKAVSFDSKIDCISTDELEEIYSAYKSLQ